MSNNQYIILQDPSDYSFLTDDIFPGTIHNFKLIFALFLFLFWIFRNILRWKENDILAKEKDKRNIVCVNISRRTARGLTRDHLLRFLNRLYKKENKPCGKVFLPATIRKESIKTAFVFPQIEQDELLQHLENKYKNLIPLPMTHAAQTNPIPKPQFKPGQIVSFEADNETQLGLEHEPQLLITFFVQSISDCGGATIFPFLGVKTSSLYTNYDKFYGTRSQGLYLTPGNGLYPSRSKYQHGNFRDAPGSKERLIAYKQNQMQILRDWLPIYKRKLARAQGRLGDDDNNNNNNEQQSSNNNNANGTTTPPEIPHSTDDVDDNQQHLNDFKNNSDDVELTTMKSSKNQEHIIDINALTMDPYANPQPTTTTTSTPNQQIENNQRPFDGIDSDGEESDDGNEEDRQILPRDDDGGDDADGADIEQNPAPTITTSSTTTTPKSKHIRPNRHPPQNTTTTTSTKPQFDPKTVPTGSKKHISGVYTTDKATLQRRINSYQTDPRYARSGNSFATLTKTCPIEGIKAMQTLQPIVVKNSSNLQGQFASIKIPLSTIDKLVQTKYQYLKAEQLQKNSLATRQLNASSQSSGPNPHQHSFLPLVFVVTGTVGDAVVSEIIHLDFATNYCHDLFPQRHFIQFPKSHIATTTPAATPSQTATATTDSTPSTIPTSESDPQPDIIPSTTTDTTTTQQSQQEQHQQELKLVDQTNLISIVDSVLSTRDLYNKQVTDHINPDSPELDSNSNSKPIDTRLPLQYQLLRSGRITTPFYQDIYELKRPAFTTIETGLHLQSYTYNNYWALFPTFGLSQESDGTDCNICYCEPKRVIALPCRHIATCQPCATQLVKCCLCRSDIQSFCTFIVSPTSSSAENNENENVTDIVETQPHSTPQQIQQRLQAHHQQAAPGTTDLTTDQDDVIVINGISRTQQQWAMQQYLDEQRRLEREAIEQQQLQQRTMFSGLLGAQSPTDNPDELNVIFDENDINDDDENQDSQSIMYRQESRLGDTFHTFSQMNTPISHDASTTSLFSPGLLQQRPSVLPPSEQPTSTIQNDELSDDDHDHMASFRHPQQSEANFGRLQTFEEIDEE